MFGRRTFLFGATCFTAACTTFWAALPTVNTIVSYAILVLQQIGRAIDEYFASKPNPDLQKKVMDAFKKTIAALEALTAISKSTTDIHDANFVAALKDFEDAYNALLEIIAPIGIVQEGKEGATPKDVQVILTVPSAKKLCAFTGSK